MNWFKHINVEQIFDIDRVLDGQVAILLKKVWAA